MGRGAKPKGKVKTKWSPKFAYAIGLLTADGCLSKDGRHINLTSADSEQIQTFIKCLAIDTRISKKRSGSGNLSYYTQFSDIIFYRFLVGIGLLPAKSKTISTVNVPDAYFPDFLRGYFDGDGSSYSYYDPKFKKSYRFYISFTSASPKFIKWLREKIRQSVNIGGHLSFNCNTPYIQLKYAKKEAVKICKFMYKNKNMPYLRRKYLKIRRSMCIIGQTPRW